MPLLLFVFADNVKHFYKYKTISKKCVSSLYIDNLILQKALAEGGFDAENLSEDQLDNLDTLAKEVEAEEKGNKDLKFLYGDSFNELVPLKP